MGIFNFKKKKDIPFPSNPAEQKEEPEVVDFDKLLSEVPPPPLDLKSGPGASFGAMPAQDLEKELGFSEPFNAELTPVPAEPEPISTYQIPPLSKGKQNQLPVSETAKPALPKFNLDSKPAVNSKPTERDNGFELPDFDDKEMKELEELKIAETEHVERKFEPGPKIDYPKPMRPVLVADEKFFDVRSYLNTKEDINTVKNLAGDMELLLGKYIDTTKAKNDKYHVLANELNVLQEKLMLIDNKLFEDNI
ncbi:MAG: hypothetical protein KKF46_07035 [Nanoarchaeota archaeon]|nr:hypothetical protein [Nanoarchaeota archaeon]MBU1322083.1 hypothetical protein [Nanoarchaeota archaeon]MBU1598189.1 hypothetical protein [Nanoarchaeota archaeon]MBU2441319.1 hypothetical protein [Nanoarchaeota archaeon]